ncbi:hypothetical protein J7E99_26540 [Streptomyces sp. ISL-44]|nr:hypothetical protein [Streptomyces sp. ISL-44]MBT2544164.1 hypothetical protein [Streptomyces sp. ISL-44]
MLAMLLHNTSSIADAGNSACLVNHTPRLRRVEEDLLRPAPLEERRVT